MPWFECRLCQGDEGEMVDGEWVDCKDCQGSGGFPDDQQLQVREFRTEIDAAEAESSLQWAHVDAAQQLAALNAALDGPSTRS
ncbi:hypothetical protein ACQP1O_43125 (plasmid) [Nocardia sp. CA-151230]|uniref:hypothetical protein n=1 Tax=Nocardia sp. CA-151230 TaxID=3239982 RepID=UPI003D8FF48C